MELIPKEPSIEKSQDDGKSNVAEKGAKEVDVTIVDQTLNEILADFNPNLPNNGPSAVAAWFLRFSFLNNLNMLVDNTIVGSWTIIPIFGEWGWFSFLLHACSLLAYF